MFSVQEVLTRVTHSDKAANEIFATYMSAGSTPEVRAAELQSAKADAMAKGWMHDDEKEEWYFMHPVPSLVWNNDASNPLPVPVPADAVDNLQECLDDLVDMVAKKTEAYEFANMLSSGYQYKTRPNLKKASTKGAAQARFDDLNKRFSAAAEKDPSLWMKFQPAMLKGTEGIKGFLEEWAKTAA